MGGVLPRAVDTTVVERHESKGWRIGVSEMNGWRMNMEDAHLVHTCEDWGFFGIFDGHGGDACSVFVAPRMGRELQEKGCPKDDAAVRQMLYDIDEEFLKKEEEGGSTATMCIVQKPRETGAKYRLRVINCGDSRVVLGNLDGTIVNGGGTDQGLTTDHKPDNPDERERIEKAGETVTFAINNCARVSGNLAVCRGFGDGRYKYSSTTDRETSGRGPPEDRAVTVEPELNEFECDESQFVVLVCDGVVEGDFSNSQVVALVASELKKSNDPGAAARAVCFKALDANSKDNISCMVVTFDGKEASESRVQLFPGRTDSLSENPYRTAYEAMAKRAHYSIAEAVELRYVMLKSMLDPESESSLTESKVASIVGSCCLLDDGSLDLDDLKAELKSFGQVVGEPGSQERREFFEAWVNDLGM